MSLAGIRRNFTLLLVAGLVLTTGLSCLLQPDPNLLVSWLPLVAMLAAAQVTDWLRNRRGPVKLYWPKFTELPPVPLEGRPQSKLARLAGIRHGRRALAQLAVLGLAGWPLFGYLFNYRATPAPPHSQRLAPLQHLVPTNAIVLTDQPERVASSHSFKDTKHSNHRRYHPPSSKMKK